MQHHASSKSKHEKHKSVSKNPNENSAAKKSLVQNHNIINQQQ